MNSRLGGLRTELICNEVPTAHQPRLSPCVVFMLSSDEFRLHSLTEGIRGLSDSTSTQYWGWSPTGGHPAEQFKSLDVLKDIGPHTLGIGTAM